ncbi:hypothetical protein IFM89_014957 [Coptis chinensis]|uniref:KIB1-4 beta-propeller domain-containing protein n=1 Tax=Coptis chinensis TaxID=261450 RepID=A0A835H6A2_9MAGN|nr:hypothetical protein IFM89_014957 [Coptis chinensis]
MAIHDVDCKLAVARPGDVPWIPLQCSYQGFQDVIFYKGQFYAVTETGRIVVCRIGDRLENTSPKDSSVMHFLQYPQMETSFYLVERLGELLLLVSRFPDKVVPETGRFKIYKLNLRKESWCELMTFGEHALFLGINTSVALLASDLEFSV